MMRNITLSGLLLGLLLFSFSAIAAEGTGTVCLGQNLAKPYSEHTDRLYLKIDDSPPIYFERPYTGPRVVARGLDVNRIYRVKVYFDDKVAQSWNLDFSRFPTKAVLIWRAAGSWRMEEIEASECR